MCVHARTLSSVETREKSRKATRAHNRVASSASVKGGQRVTVLRLLGYILYFRRVWMLTNPYREAIGGRIRMLAYTQGSATWVGVRVRVRIRDRVKVRDRVMLTVRGRPQTYRRSGSGWCSRQKSGNITAEPHSDTASVHTMEWSGD